MRAVSLERVEHVRRMTEGNEQNPHGNLVVQRPAVVRKGAVQLSSDLEGEIGTTGLRQYGGFVIEEWLTQLAGRKAAWVWREMQDNDPVIGAILFAVKWLARGVPWTVKQGKDAKAQELVETAMHDMSHTWGDLMSECLSMLGYGYSYHELVYKKCLGEQKERAVFAASSPSYPVDARGPIDDTRENDTNPASSKFNDGMIRWRKIPIRAQETLLRWHFDGYSGIAAFEQIDWHGGNHVIPIEKALLFRTQTTRNNPEGRSMLRNAYTSYYSIKGIKNIEAVGIERDLAGIPVATPPDGVDLFAPANSALLAEVQKMVTAIRRDEYEGVVLPSSGWKLELMSSGGSRQIDTDAIIRRYRQDIAVSLLADFVLIGQDSVGSYAMVDVKADLFGIALDAILDLICEVFNRYAIPRLLALNGMDVSDPPQIQHASAGRISLEKVGMFLNQIALAGAPIPWSVELLKELFTEAGLPADFSDHTPVETPHVPEPPEPGQQGTPLPQEAHPVAPANAAAPTSTAPPGPKNPVKKDDAVPLGHGQPDGTTIFDVGAALDARKSMLGDQLEKELQSTLLELGTEAYTAYLTHGTVEKAQTRLQEAQRIANKVIQALNLKRWITTRIMPLLKNHASRVVADTERTLSTETGLELKIAEEDVTRIAQTAGAHLGMTDIFPPIREAILAAVRHGLATGQGPEATARIIRTMVPAGRFTNAGSSYRARLIARDKTGEMQRDSVLAAYKSNPNIKSVQLRDGIFGAPRSDSQCIERDGEIVPIDDVDSVHPYHPQCTLSFNPVVS